MDSKEVVKPDACDAPSRQGSHLEAWHSMTHMRPGMSQGGWAFAARSPRLPAGYSMKREKTHTNSSTTVDMLQLLNMEKLLHHGAACRDVDVPIYQLNDDPRIPVTCCNDRGLTSSFVSVVTLVRASNARRLHKTEPI